jgi:hypothetical protein
MVRAEFPAKEIVAVAPPMMGHSNDLIAVCQFKKKITPAQIGGCLFPQYVKDSNCDLPRPGSPTIMTSWPSPCRARSQRRVSIAISVALDNTVRDMHRCMTATRLEKTGHQSARCRAIDIVIAENGNGFTVEDGFF